MRVFTVAADRFAEEDGLPAELPPAGFVWLACDRDAFEGQLAAVQRALSRWGLSPLVDLHVSDLLNAQLPSHFDYTSWYDLLVFRRLSPGSPGSAAPAGEDSTVGTEAARAALAAIDTRPVGFVIFDRVLLSVHPAECGVSEHFAQRLAALGTPSEGRGGPRLPASPADLMLRMVNHLVDGYLDLRRVLTRHLGYLQSELLSPRSRFDDWQVLLDARNALHWLEDTCEDQRSAVQEWIDTLEEWPPEPDAERRRERELLQVRSRDVLEHVERVLTHVRRLEQSAETAVQMHFSALGHRTNDIMRTLTVLTAVFLPLNLITGFFGMNFDFLPLIHSSAGFWVSFAVMVAIGAGLVAFFRRKRYLG